MSEQSPTLSLNGKEYDLNTQSDEAKQLIARIQKTEELVQFHKVEAVILEDARAAQLNALEGLLENPVEIKE